MSDIDKLCRCNNCDWEGLESKLGLSLGEIRHLAERLDPGAVVPAGECPIPDCRAFAYLVPEPSKYHLLIVGSPVDGLRHFGPFETGDEAVAAGEGLPSDWWTAELISIADQPEIESRVHAPA